jgi:hypothetical protein
MATTTCTAPPTRRVEYSNAPIHAITNRTYTQVFGRLAMSKIWAMRNNLDASQAKMVDALYKLVKKRGPAWCESNITYRLCTSRVGELGFGRYYGKTGSLERLEKDIRGTLCSEFYDDVDIVNCHPTLIPQLARTWYGLEMPTFDDYVARRSAWFKMMEERLQFSDEMTKGLVLRIMYGGSLPDKVKLPDDCETRMPIQFRHLQNEMHQLTRAFKADPAFRPLYDHLLKQKERNTDGALASCIIQTEERKCLEAAVGWLDERGYRVDVLAYDGCQIRKSDDKPVTDALLADLAAVVKDRTGYDLAFKVKPFETIHFDEEAEEAEEGVVDEETRIDDLYACRRLVELLGPDIQKQDRTIYIYDPKRGLWRCDKGAPLAAVHRFADNLVFKQKVKGGETKVFNYGGMTKNINQMLHHLAEYEFEETNAITPTANKGCLLFKNGWFEMATQTFHSGFETCREKYFTRRIPFDFYAQRDSDLEDHVRRALFRNAYKNPAVGDYYANVVARAVAGHVEDRVFHSVVGRPACGKGVMTQALCATFHEYVTEMNLNVFKINTRDSNDEAKKLAWYAPLVGLRVVCGNEARIDGKPLDGNLMKTLSSGGDTLDIRGNFENQRKVHNSATFFAFCNDLPPVSPCDEALKGRMSSIPHTKSFVPKPQAECNEFEMEADPHIKDRLLTREWQQAFFWVIMGAYGPRVPKPAEVVAECDELFEVQDATIRDLLQERYEFTTTDDEESYVTARDIIKYLQGEGLAISDTKIGRELKALGFRKDSKRVDGKVQKVWFGLRV